MKTGESAPPKSGLADVAEAFGNLTNIKYNLTR